MRYNVFNFFSGGQLILNKKGREFLHSLFKMYVFVIS